LQLGYPSLDVLYVGYFLWDNVVVYEVRSQQFVGYVQVSLVDDFFGKAAHQGFVILFDRHRSFLLATPTRRPLPGRHHEHDAIQRALALQRRLFTSGVEGASSKAITAILRNPGR
jgi:hypothetical protein